MASRSVLRARRSGNRTKVTVSQHLPGLLLPPPVRQPVQAAVAQCAAVSSQHSPIMGPPASSSLVSQCGVPPGNTTDSTSIKLNNLAATDAEGSIGFVNTETWRKESASLDQLQMLLCDVLYCNDGLDGAGCVLSHLDMRGYQSMQELVAELNRSRDIDAYHSMPNEIFWTELVLRRALIGRLITESTANDAVLTSEHMSSLSDEFTFFRQLLQFALTMPHHTIQDIVDLIETKQNLYDFLATPRSPLRNNSDEFLMDCRRNIRKLCLQELNLSRDINFYTTLPGIATVLELRLREGMIKWLTQQFQQLPTNNVSSGILKECLGQEFKFTRLLRNLVSVKVISGDGVTFDRSYSSSLQPLNWCGSGLNKNPDQNANQNLHRHDKNQTHLSSLKNGSNDSRETSQQSLIVSPQPSGCCNQQVTTNSRRGSPVTSRLQPLITLADSVTPRYSLCNSTDENEILMFSETAKFSELKMEEFGRLFAQPTDERCGIIRLLCDESKKAEILHVQMQSWGECCWDLFIDSGCDMEDFYDWNYRVVAFTAIDVSAQGKWNERKEMGGVMRRFRVEFNSDAHADEFASQLRGCSRRGDSERLWNRQEIHYGNYSDLTEAPKFGLAESAVDSISCPFGDSCASIYKDQNSVKQDDRSGCRTRRDTERLGEKVNRENEPDVDMVSHTFVDSCASLNSLGHNNRLQLFSTSDLLKSSSFDRDLNVLELDVKFKSCTIHESFDDPLSVVKHAESAEVTVIESSLDADGETDAKN